MSQIDERELQELANDFIACVGEDLGVELDYDYASLEKVDALREDLQEIGKALGSEREDFYTLMVGAYFGEVLRRKLGGRWDFANAFGPAVEHLQDALWSLPFTTARDWLSGSDESFAFTFRCCKRKVDNPEKYDLWNPSQRDSTRDKEPDPGEPKRR